MTDKSFQTERRDGANVFRAVAACRKLAGVSVE
jgi:hypothetical protein